MHLKKLQNLKHISNTQTGHYTILSEINKNVHPWEGFPCET